MLKHSILDLSECTEYRQLLESRPPRFVHATAYLLLSLTVAAIAWAHFSTAELIVRAPGRVRPIHTPVKIISAARAESLSGGHANRISELYFHEGDHVSQGQVLLRLDATRLQNAIEECRARSTANESELARMDDLESLLQVEYAAAHEKALAELRQAREDARVAEERRQAELQVAEADTAAAQRELETQEPLVAKRVVTTSEFEKTKQTLQRALADRDKARLRVNDGPQRVLEQALELVQRQHDVKLKELAMKRGEATARAKSLSTELQNLELEIAQAVIHSPIDGVVITGDLKVGDFVEPNKVLLEVAETTGFRFEAQLSAEDVALVVGKMPARVKLDAYDYQRCGAAPGVVDFVSPDSTLDKDAKAPYYAVRIEVPGELPQRDQVVRPLKFGMTGQVEIVTERRSLLSLLISRVKQSIRLG